MRRNWWARDLTLSQLEVLGGFAGVVLAFAALAYAKMVADEQGEIIDKQLNILQKQAGILEDHKAIFLRLEGSEGRQEALLTTQSELTKQLAQVTVQQHAIMT